MQLFLDTLQSDGHSCGFGVRISFQALSKPWLRQIPAYDCLDHHDILALLAHLMTTTVPWPKISTPLAAARRCVRAVADRTRIDADWRTSIHKVEHLKLPSRPSDRLNFRLRILYIISPPWQGKDVLPAIRFAPPPSLSFFPSGSRPPPLGLTACSCVFDRIAQLVDLAGGRRLRPATFCARDAHIKR